MPATDVKFGITLHPGTLIESLEVDRQVEKKELKGSNGNIARVHSYNPTNSFNVKGHGALTVVPGIGTSQISSLTGGVTLIEHVKQSESNDDFDAWEYSGTHYPNAQDV